MLQIIVTVGDSRISQFSFAFRKFKCGEVTSITCQALKSKEPSTLTLTVKKSTSTAYRAFNAHRNSPFDSLSMRLRGVVVDNMPPAVQQRLRDRHCEVSALMTRFANDRQEALRAPGPRQDVVSALDARKPATDVCVQMMGGGLL